MSDLNIDEKVSLLNTKQVAQQAVVVGNIIELISSCVKNLADTQLSDSIEHSNSTKQVLANMVGKSLLDSVSSENC
jgi:ABC-type uncharacterized transport system substrate-binding protein